jgi:hypothetical protein
VYFPYLMFLALALPSPGDIVGSSETRLKLLAKQFVNGASCAIPEELWDLGGSKVQAIWDSIQRMTSRGARHRPDIGWVATLMSAAGFSCSQ